jgi:hypothetical protein
MISLFQGDSKVFNLTVQDKSQPQNPDGSYPPFDLTGCTVQLSVLKGSNGTLQKTVAGMITGSPTAGLASVTLDRDTSDALATGAYSARFEVLKGSTLQYTVYSDRLKVG